jgi:hypothetical protein
MCVAYGAQRTRDTIQQVWVKAYSIAAPGEHRVRSPSAFVVADKHRQRTRLELGGRCSSTVCFLG